MSIVIVGGNERMVCQYQNICKCHGCKAKVFAKEKGAMKKKLGCPDLMIPVSYTHLGGTGYHHTCCSEGKQCGSRGYYWPVY